MSNGTTLEATMRLEISQLQAALAKSQAEVDKWQSKLQSGSSKTRKAVMTVAEAYENTQAKARQAAAVNPWASNAAAAAQYAQIVEQRVVPALQKQSQWSARTGETYDTNRILSQQAAASRGSGSRGSMGGGGGRWAIGNAAMQLQDIAVQAQAGTRASIILAQQGSQLASAFGPAGMIAGGVVAIGGAFYTMGERAREAFDNVMASSREFQKDSALLIQSTNAENLVGHLSQVRQQMIAIQAEQKNLNTFFGDWAARIGGGDPGAMNAQLQNQMAAQGEIYSQSVDRALVNSKKQTEITQLLAEGRKDEADTLQRSMELGNELARIDAMRIQEWAKDRLKADAVTRSEASASGQDNAGAREKILAIQQQLNAEQLAALDPVERFIALSREQDAVFASMAEKGGMFYEQSIAGLEAWAAARGEMNDPAGQLETLEMLRTAVDLQQQMNAANEEAKALAKDRDREADKKRDEAAADKARRDAEADRFGEYVRQQQAGKKALAEDIQMAQAKISGNTTLLAQMERELAIREKTKQIQDQLGNAITAEQARASAAMIVDADGLPIGGARTPSGRRARTSGPLYSGGPLSSRSGPLSASGGSLADRAVTAAGRQDAREKQDTRGINLGSQILQVLQNGLQ